MYYLIRVCYLYIELIDQDALVDALKNKRIGGVGLDVTTPEPLPKDHPLLQFSNAGNVNV